MCMTISGRESVSLVEAGGADAGHGAGGGEDWWSRWEGLDVLHYIVNVSQLVS